MLKHQSAAITSKLTEVDLSLGEEEALEDVGRNADLYISHEVVMQDQSSISASVRIKSASTNDVMMISTTTST